MAKITTQLLRKFLDTSSDHEPGVKVTLDIEAVAVGGPEHGVYMMLVAETTTGCLFGSSAVGDKKMRAEQVATEAVEHLVGDLKAGGCVDEYLQDQLIIFMALAAGTSRMLIGPLSLHSETAIFWAQHILGARFSVKPCKQNEVACSSSHGHNNGSTDSQDAEVNSTTTHSFLIECEGVGYMSRFVR